MKTRYLLAVCAALLAVVGMTIAQPQPKLPPTIPAPGVPTAPDLPPARGAVPAGQPLPALGEFRAVAVGKPEELTIDQLIEAVEGFREQKAEVEKKERAFLKVLHHKAHLQKVRIDGLGGDGVPSLVPGPVGPSSNSIPPAPAPGTTISH